MQSTTRINMDEMSRMLSLYFVVDVSIFFMEMDSSSIHWDIKVQWEKVENGNSND